MSFIKILRPFNCLFVAISVLFGAYYNNMSNHLLPVIFASLSAVFIAAAGYVINDFFDLPIDIINKPNRILPSGKIKPKAAYMFAVLLFISGITFSFFTQSIYCVLLAILNTFFLFYYAKTYKMKFLSGNLIVAYAAASTFIFGGLSNLNFRNSFVIAILAFLYTLIREFIKDAEDIEGDIKLGANTLAIKFGKKKTALIAFLPALVIIALNFYFYYKALFLVHTFLAMNFLVSLPLVIFAIYLLRNLNKQGFYRVSTWMKIDMFILLLILWFGK